MESRQAALPARLHDKPEASATRIAKRSSNQLSVMLDVEDLVPGPHYILEIKLTRLDRKLTKPAEFERFAGRLARISNDRTGGEPEIFRGPSGGSHRRQVQIEVQAGDAVPMEGIRKANLVVDSKVRENGQSAVSDNRADQPGKAH